MSTAGWYQGPEWQQPPPPPEEESGRHTWVVVTIAVFAVLAIAGSAIAIVAVVGGEEEAGATEVFLEGADDPGDNPFTDDVATPDQPVPTTTTLATSTTAPKGQLTSYSGGLPGLYGGTRDLGSCDAAKMVDFLEANPDKAAAWASVRGIDADDIRSYVATLTSVVLTTDTRVTNHGFSGGRATTIAAVLQAGTAVLVDDHGIPVVKCNCGNPLTAPRPVATPTYAGRRWSGFSETRIVVIERTEVVIEQYVLIDVAGTLFSRPVGTNGDADGPAPGEEDPATTTTTAPTSSTSSTSTTAPRSTTSTRAPTTTAAPTTQTVRLDASSSFGDATYGGSQSWSAVVTVSPNGSVSGSGSGFATGVGTCHDSNGDVVSEYEGNVSFTVSVTGSASGGSMTATVTAPSGTLDSLIYSADHPANAVCRQQAESTYMGFVADFMGGFTVALSDGASGTVSAVNPGTVRVDA